MKVLSLALLTGALCFAPALYAQTPQKWHVYVGTNTGKESQGIYLLEMDMKSGALASKGLVAETTNPSFVAIHPTKKYLYAVSEISNFDKKKTGAISAFAIEPKTGKLTLLNQQPSGGTGPCHVVTDKAGKFVLAANYGGGSVCSIPVGADGKLGEPVSVIQHAGSSVLGNQKGPHAHSINLDAANKFAMAADLGLDKVLVYRFDTDKGTLTANTPVGATLAPGSGPRHFAFHPNGKYAFVINEMKLTLTSFKYDANNGTLTEIETLSTIPAGITDTKGFSTAEVVVHPNGKLVYGSNRGQNSIAIFTFDPEKGKLAHVGNESRTISTPRNFLVDPTGTYLLAANQSGGSVTVFRIDQSTGKLEQVGEPTKVPTPVCLRMIPVE